MMQPHEFKSRNSSTSIQQHGPFFHIQMVAQNYWKPPEDKAQITLLIKSNTHYCIFSFGFATTWDHNGVISFIQMSRDDLSVQKGKQSSEISELRTNNWFWPPLF